MRWAIFLVNKLYVQYLGKQERWKGLQGNSLVNAAGTTASIFRFTVELNAVLTTELKVDMLETNKAEVWHQCFMLKDGKHSQAIAYITTHFYACSWGASDVNTNAQVGTRAIVVILFYKQGLQHIIVGTIFLYSTPPFLGYVIQNSN